MDPATIAAVTALVKVLAEVLGPFMAGWFLPQPKKLRRTDPKA